eukprot:6204416-Pleurochrysis_carterae.AAC.1
MGWARGGVQGADPPRRTVCARTCVRRVCDSSVARVESHASMQRAARTVRPWVATPLPLPRGACDPPATPP